MCVLCVVRSLCSGLITRTEECYRMWCFWSVIVEPGKGKPGQESGRSATGVLELRLETSFFNSQTCLISNERKHGENLFSISCDIFHSSWSSCTSHQYRTEPHTHEQNKCTLRYASHFWYRPHRTLDDKTGDCASRVAAITVAVQYRKFLDNFQRYLIVCSPGVKQVCCNMW